MKSEKFTFKTLLWIFLFAFIALIFVRIFILDHYPSEMKQFTFTEKMKAAYSTDVDSFAVYKQDLMAPYDDPRDGNFFADYMLCVPAHGELQACIRYNDSTLPRVAEFYKTELPEGDPLALFDFSLLVSYETDNKDGEYRRYQMNTDEAFTAQAFMYSYAKLIFEDVDFEGAIWMRVDIYLRGTEEGYTKENCFGSIVLYESYEIRNNGQKVEYPLFPYSLSGEEKKHAA